MKEYTVFELRHEIPMSEPQCLSADEVIQIVCEYVDRSHAGHHDWAEKTFSSEEEAIDYIKKRTICSDWVAGCGSLLFLSVTAYELWEDDFDEDGEPGYSSLIASYYAPAEA